MKTLSEYLEEYNDNLMFEMSNLGQQTTGLPCVVWVQVNVEGQLKGKHSIPRLKIQNCDKKFIPVSIEDEPRLLGNCTIKETDLSTKDYNEVVNWIKKNKDTLLQYWNDEFDCVEDLIKKLQQ